MTVFTVRSGGSGENFDVFLFVVIGDLVNTVGIHLSETRWVLGGFVLFGEYVFDVVDVLTFGVVGVGFFGSFVF